MMGYSMRTVRFRLTVWVDYGGALTVDLTQRPMRISLDTEALAASASPRRLDPRRIVAVELYDLDADPGENLNVAGEALYAQDRARLLELWRGGWQAARAGLLEKWRKSKKDLPAPWLPPGA